MNDRLLIGTRKGLFELRRTRGTWSIASTHFLGDPICMLLADPRDPHHITVGVSTGGVWVTEDGGTNWRASVAGMYAEYVPPEQRHAPQVQDVHRLVQCPAAPDTMWVQHHNGVFRSTDAAR